MYTKITTGCQCYWNASRYDCACCYPGGCQCTQANQHQCVVCGDEALCGKRKSLQAILAAPYRYKQCGIQEHVDLFF